MNNHVNDNIKMKMKIHLPLHKMDIVHNSTTKNLFFGSNLKLRRLKSSIERIIKWFYECFVFNRFFCGQKKNNRDVNRVEMKRKKKFMTKRDFRYNFHT